MKKRIYSFKNLTVQEQLIVGQMAIDEIPLHIQRFYLNVLNMLSNEFVTIKSLALAESYSERTVTNYMSMLRKKGYVMRYNYRAWVLGSELCEDGYVLRTDNIFGKCAIREGCRL